MNCKDALELLSASLDGELTPEEETRLQAHLASCPRCRDLREQLGQIHRACGEMEAVPPAGLRENILKNLPDQKAAKAHPWRRWGAMAAAVALVALAAWRLPHTLYQPDRSSGAAQESAVPAPLALGPEAPVMDRARGAVEAAPAAAPESDAGSVVKENAVSDAAKSQADTFPAPAGGQAPVIDLWSLGQFRAVVTVEGSDRSWDYPAQLQDNGEMWYLLPASALDDLPGALGLPETEYTLRTEGDDLDPQGAHILLVAPAP